MKKLTMTWTEGSETTLLELVYPHPGDDPCYYQINKDHWHIGQAVKTTEGWWVYTQYMAEKKSKTPLTDAEQAALTRKRKLTSDDIQIIENYLNMDKIQYNGEELSISMIDQGHHNAYEIIFPNGQLKTLVPFEVSGKKEWGFQNEGVTDESIALGRFIGEYDIKVEIPILTWEEYAKDTGVKKP